MSDIYTSDQSFTVEGPPVIWDWDMDGGAFVIDANRAVAEGWYREVRDGVGVWLRDLPLSAQS